MIPRLTIDGGLLRESVVPSAVRILKTLETEGRIEMFESDRAKETKAPQAFGWPGAPAPVTQRPRFKVLRKSESGGVSFQRIAGVLFPQRDPQRLNMTEVNNVAHLLRHHSLGHTIFVTADTETFIAQGKRERLLAAFKIMVLTPGEAVLALRESEDKSETASSPPTKRVAHE